LGAFALAGLLGGLLYDTNPRDPVAFVAVAGFVLIMTLLAAALPARRASRVNPLLALRAE
jgi:ABC-type lipoprotein release transport system permease subunit